MTLQLKNIYVTKEKNQILRGINLDVPTGSFYIIIGPTGSGKTTLLRTAGLLEKPESGKILFQDNPVPTNTKQFLQTRRKIVTMFQDPVMFKGTVESNIAWGLTIRKESKATIQKKVTRILEFVDLKGYEKRRALTLSGGETRRVALARALVLEPELLILDEPTTSLDPALKRDLLSKIREMHARSGITFLMATHDFAEALSVGTEGAVIKDGQIAQSGSIEEILFKPNSQFMASFTGTRNIFPADFRGTTARIGEVTFTCAEEKRGSGFLVIPPEVIVLSKEAHVTSERNRFIGIVKSLKRNGINWDVTVEISNLAIIAHITTGALNELSIAEGSPIHLSFKASSIHIF